MTTNIGVSLRVFHTYPNHDISPPQCHSNTPKQAHKSHPKHSDQAKRTHARMRKLSTTTYLTIIIPLPKMRRGIIRQTPSLSPTLQDLNDLRTKCMLRRDGRQARFQHRNHRRQPRQDAQGRGVIGDDILSEDEIEGGEVFAVDGERVVRERVADLVLRGRVLCC